LVPHVDKQRDCEADRWG